ncbi:MAG: VanZ family protein [Thermomicrobiales bacterium]
MSFDFIVEPAAIAIVLGALLSVVLVVPMIAVQYRQWGTLSFSRLFLIFAFVLYLVAVPMYTLLPTGLPVDRICELGTSPAPRLDAFRFIHDLRWAARTMAPREFVASALVQQIVLNVILFIPLGVFLRKLNRLPVWIVILMGFGLTVLIETTQLTGNWGLSPCPYRTFEIDDIILNTSGTIVGIALSPLLGIFPGVRLQAADRTRVRPVTRTRRFIQLFCDWMIFTFIAQVGAAVVVVVLDGANVIDAATRGGDVGAAVTLIAGTALFLVFPLLTHGETPGERIVLISVKTKQGLDPGAGPILLKAFAGWMPFVILAAIAMDGALWVHLLNLAWIGFSLLYTIRHPEGFSMRLSGLRRFDDRVPLPEPGQPLPPSTAVGDSPTP